MNNSGVSRYTPPHTARQTTRTIQYWTCIILGRWLIGLLCLDGLFNPTSCAFLWRSPTPLPPYSCSYTFHTNDMLLWLAVPAWAWLALVPHRCLLSSIYFTHLRRMVVYHLKPGNISGGWKCLLCALLVFTPDLEILYLRSLRQAPPVAASGRCVKIPYTYSYHARTHCTTARGA